MMRPATLPATMRSQACRLARNMLLTFTAMILSKSSGVTSRIMRLKLMPAPFTSTATGPRLALRFLEDGNNRVGLGHIHCPRPCLLTVAR